MNRDPPIVATRSEIVDLYWSTRCCESHKEALLVDQLGGV